MQNSASSIAPINWPATLVLVGTPVAALFLIPWYGFTYGFSSSAWFTFVALLALSSMGITAGYHRLWAHRAYKASLPIRLLLMLGGTFAIQNSILYWASGHRTHHRYVDDVDKDPYSIKRGFFFAHFGWMIRNYPSGQPDYSNAKDLLNDRIVMFQHNHYNLLVLLTNIGIPALIGWAVGDLWGVMLLGGLLRLVISHHVTFFINSLCHMFGTRPYTDENTARDNMLLSIFTWGEGYHNYHHIFQYDYRNGVKWWQYDPTKWFIWSLSKFGLTSDLKRIPSFNIKKAQLDMRFKRAEKNLEIYGHNISDDMHQIRNNVYAEYEAFSQTLNDFMKLKEREIQGKKAAVSEKIHQMDSKLKSDFKNVEDRLHQHGRSLKLMLNQFKKLAKN